MDENAEVPEKKRLTDAIRAARYRVKHKQALMTKNRDRMRHVQQMQKMDREGNPTLRKEYRDKERERKMMYRQKKKVAAVSVAESEEVATTSSIGTFRSPQSFGKALQRSTAALPKSPGKKKVIIAKMAGIEGIRIRKEQRKTEESQEKALVKAFFARPDIAYICPGLKDEVLEMWANAQRDGRPAEYRWRPLFNAAKFG